MEVGGPGVITTMNTGGAAFIPGPGGVSIPGEAAANPSLNVRQTESVTSRGGSV